jgi:tetratricopeptide (TPR) repeat protein
MLSKHKSLVKMFLFPLTTCLIIACNTLSQAPVPTSSVPTFNPDWIPPTNTVITTATVIEVEESTPTISSLGVFKPGDPTATPLGNDITDPNFIDGKNAYDDKRFEEALNFFSAAIEANPDMAPPYRYRGSTYWNLGDCISGLVDEEKALSIDPNYARAWADRGLMNQCLENYVQALQDYQNALSIDPSLAFVHHNLAVYYYKLGDYEKTLEEYSLAVAIDPGRASAWNGKSEALTKLGRFDECIQNSTKALEIDAEEWLAYSDRAYCRASVGLHAAAVEDYKVYVAQDDADAVIWYNMGLSQRHAGDLEGAIDSYTMALELDPTYYPAYINRGFVYRTLENYEKSLDDYNRALELGDIPLAYSGRGDTYFGLERFDEAIADYKKTLSLIPNDDHSYCQLSLSYFEIGRYQDSLDAATTTNQINPSCGGQRLYETQARSYYALGNYDQALAYMDKALAVNRYSLGYYYRGIIYHDAGKNNEAIRDLQQFLSTVKSTDVYENEIADANARLAKLKP